MTRRSYDSAARNGQTRALIADLAARLIGEHGIHDYALAKKKAARQLGLPEGTRLPSNEEIDQALIDRQSLYEPEEHSAHLAELREEAYEVMRVFERFSPILTGSVASGAVSEHSLIELEIFPESSKDFEQALVNQDIEFKILDHVGRIAYLLYAQPADIMVRVPDKEFRHKRAAHKTQLSMKQLANLIQTAD